MVFFDFVVIFVIVVFSAVQSVVGVGLLLFGTPTLLIMGYSYLDSLVYLLPASIVISLVQMLEDNSHIDAKDNLFLYALPAVALGIYIVVRFIGEVDMKSVVGVMLLVAGMFRLFRRLSLILKIFIRRYLRSYCVATGLVHGITNMGGGFLSVMMSSIYTNKIYVRVNIALWYMMFALTQLLVLFASGVVDAGLVLLVSPVISLTTYVIIGRRVWGIVSNSLYHNMITISVFAYGAGCLLV